MVVRVQPYLKKENDFAFYKITSDWITIQDGNRILKILEDNGIKVEYR